MYERNHIPSRRKSWSVMVALVAMVASGCDESTVAPPIEEVEEEVLPGAIIVTTETSGFMKDDGYELMVDGVSAGAIGPNAQITIPELDPSTYELALGDVAENCSVEAVSVDVGADQTAETTLSVVCAPGEGTAYTIQFGRERPNLDDGVVLVCPFSICGDNTAWDIYVHNSTQTEIHAVIRQNQTLDLEIAHLPGVTLDTLTEEDVAGAVFTTELVADPFDAGRVILIRTNEGGVYALGNPVEDGTAMTLSFDAVLVSTPSP